ncbi:MAG: segregation/condensation protein A [Proteobacteria bacterium]|nr:segregation/condensation protein A [Pseudomonadota bacterium]
MNEQPIRAVDGQYVVSLQVFEGPLDMLLYLIRKHELDVFDIPIGFITQKYLEMMDLMQEMNLDLASEFIEMAAQLTYIKSRMMLPADPNAEDDAAGEPGPDPREELVRALLEYQKYKTAAEALASLPRTGRDTFTAPPVELAAEERDLAPPGLFALMEALQKVFARIGAGDGSREISVTRISISARIAQIYDMLRLRKRMPFLELFEGHAARGDVVITFLAILEMTKLGLTQLHQAGPESEIHISAAADQEDAVKIIAESNGEEA